MEKWKLKTACGNLVVQCFEGFFGVFYPPSWEDTAFLGTLSLILAWFRDALEHKQRTLAGSVLGRGQALSLDFS